ncbi:MAG: Arm DNA-binding domain-containing protein [Acidimicrobiales bacterium]|nr:Arm DNA-binding domain-containing protein [Acidimicrobiales bacterium]
MKGHTLLRGKTWAFVDIGTDPATGKRRQKWASGFERERDAKATRDYIARIERGEAVAKSSDTVASYRRDQWLPLRRLKVRESTWAGYEAEQGREFIGFIRGDRLEGLWILMLTSDMRRGELIGLKWADGDLDADRLAVRRARVAVGYRVVWS